jgi:hypothetical protein
MPAAPSGISRVRRIAAKMDGVEEGTTFGFPAFRFGGTTFAWFPKKKEVEPGSLGARMSILDREHLIAADPDRYYVTPHYLDYTSVLVRVDLLTDKELRDLLDDARDFIVSDAKRKKAMKSRRSRQ